MEPTSNAAAEGFRARYAQAADVFTNAAGAVTDWQAPTPVAEWRAVGVIDHLTSWLPAFLAEATPLRLVPTVSAQQDPLGAWRRLDDQVRSVLDDPRSLSTAFAHPMAGESGLLEAIDQFFTTDVLLHTWDLERSAGLPDSLPAGVATAMLAGMEPAEEMLRASGQFGTRREVGADATAPERLMAFLGRDPAWRARSAR